MKKIVCLMLAIFICAALAGCGVSEKRSGVVNQSKSVNDVINDKINNGGSDGKGSGGSRTGVSDALPEEYKTVDVDLTKLNSTMVYSEVYNMMNSPDSYTGKKVRMNGAFTYAEGENRYYFACLIADATACCAQGIEFVLKNERSFPGEYPDLGESITVVGIFDTYYEGSYRYCQLVDAVIE